MADIDQKRDLNEGYVELENKIIKVFQTWPIDFEAAQELVRQGANLNAEEKDNNILSTILSSYWIMVISLVQNHQVWNGDVEVSKSDDPLFKETMLKIIRFFLDNGFDVHKNEERYGALCLEALAFSVYNSSVIPAAKILLNAGAQNISLDPENSENTLLDKISTECSYQRICCYDYHLGNINEAFFQVVMAHEEGRDYSRIESYEAAVGKRILKVFAEKPKTGNVFFDIALPKSTHSNCFDQTLYFVFDAGALIITSDVYIWVNRPIPNVETVDVSDAFPGIVGSVIESFSFDHNDVVKRGSCFVQAIAALHMDNGASVTFRTNFGEVKNWVAYFQLN